MPTDDAALGDLVVRTARVLRRAHREALEPYGLSPHQARAMGVIAQLGDGLRLSRLATELGIAPRSATEVVDALEMRGLVHRSPCANDRRATEIHLTSGGSALRRTLEKARVTAGQAHFAVLNETDRVELGRLLGAALDGETPDSAGDSDCRSK